MCLELKETGWVKAKKADTDITVYKFLLKETSIKKKFFGLIKKKEINYCGPFRVFNKFFYDFNKKYVEKDFVYELIGEVFIGFHSFTREVLAIKIAQELKRRYNEEYVVTECTIPAGAYYYEGDFVYDGMFSTYCSNEIIVNRIIS